MMLKNLYPLLFKLFPTCLLLLLAGPALMAQEFSQDQILNDTRTFEVSACKPSKHEIVTVWMEKRPERKDNNADAEDMRVAYKYSDNNGKSWTAKGIVDLPETFATGNPFVTSNEKGDTYLVCMHIGKDFYSGNISLYEFDFKTKRFSLKSVPFKSGDKLLDKPALLSHGNEIHLVYVAYPQKMKNSVKYQMSKDKGKTWTAPVDVFDSNTSGHLGPSIAMTKNKQVIISIGGYGQSNIKITRKLDSDRAAFEKPVVVNAPSGKQGSAMTELSSYKNGLILTWQSPHQRDEVYLSYSKDDGLNWARPIMVTAFGNLASAAFDDKGNIHCIYADFSDQQFSVNYKLFNPAFEVLKSAYLLPPRPYSTFNEYLGAYQRLLIQEKELYAFWIDYPDNSTIKFRNLKPYPL